MFDPKINQTAISKGIPVEHDINADSSLLRSLVNQSLLGSTPQIDTVKPSVESQGKLLGEIIDLSNEYILYAKTHQNHFTRNPNGDDQVHIMMAPPWERSNDLFEALSQFTGIPQSRKTISAVKNFLYKIMRGENLDPNQDKKLDYNDIMSVWDNTFHPHKLIKMIQALSHNLLEDITNHLNEIPLLAKTLAEYTHTEYTVGKVNSLSGFFSGQKSDLNNDGRVDYNDVIAYWNGLDDSTPRFPYAVDIDFNNDGQFDYLIRDNKIFKYMQNGIAYQQVENIPGVNLTELASEIENKYKEAKYSDKKVDFELDIDHDGKKDRIYGWETYL